MPDAPAAILAGIRERWAQLGPLYRNTHFLLDAVVQDIPSLLAAVEAALKQHQPIERRKGWPPTCSFDNHRWPCAEIEAITAALTGEEAGEQPVIDMGYLSLPADLQAAIEERPAADPLGQQPVTAASDPENVRDFCIRAYTASEEREP